MGIAVDVCDCPGVYPRRRGWRLPGGAACTLGWVVPIGGRGVERSGEAQRYAGSMNRFRRLITAFVWIWQIRDSVTLRTPPISARVKPS